MSYPIRDVRPTFELTGRNYIVTGGAQGIGFTIARAICEMGGNVSIWDIQDKPVNQEEFDSLSSRFGSKTLYIQADVTKQASLEAAFQKTLDNFKSIDGCVPAAGIAIDKPFVDQTWEEFTRIQEINVRHNAPRPGILFTDFDIGPRHILHGTDGHQRIDQAKETWQHPPHRVSVSTHRPTRLQDGCIQRLQGRCHDVGQGARRGIGTTPDKSQHDITWFRGL